MVTNCFGNEKKFQQKSKSLKWKGTNFHRAGKVYS